MRATSVPDEDEDEDSPPAKACKSEALTLDRQVMKRAEEIIAGDFSTLDTRSADLHPGYFAGDPDRPKLLDATWFMREFRRGKEAEVAAMIKKDPTVLYRIARVAITSDGGSYGAELWRYLAEITDMPRETLLRMTHVACMAVEDKKQGGVYYAWFGVKLESKAHLEAAIKAGYAFDKDSEFDVRGRELLAELE